MGDIQLFRMGMSLMGLHEWNRGVGGGVLGRRRTGYMDGYAYAYAYKV